MITYVSNITVSGIIQYEQYDVKLMCNQIFFKIQCGSKSNKILFTLLQLDMWRHPRKGNHSMDVYVEPEKLEPVLGALKDIGAHVKIWIDDLQK